MLAMTAIVVGGVTIVIVPLLALTADQLTRLNAAVQQRSRRRVFETWHSAASISTSQSSTSGAEERVTRGSTTAGATGLVRMRFFGRPPTPARVKCQSVLWRRVLSSLFMTSRRAGEQEAVVIDVDPKQTSHNRTHPKVWVPRLAT